MTRREGSGKITRTHSRTEATTMFDDDRPTMEEMKRSEPFTYDPQNPQWLDANSDDERLWTELVRLSVSGFSSMPFSKGSGHPANPPSSGTVSKKAMEVADAVIAGLRLRRKMHRPGEPFFTPRNRDDDPCRDCDRCGVEEQETSTAVARSESDRKGLRGKRK